ncbi:unnamed protein product, partial [marine sediment metagenome]
MIMPLGISDTIKELLEKGRRPQLQSKEDIEEQGKIIEEIEIELKSNKEIKTDFVQNNPENNRFIFSFRIFEVREQLFQLIEDHKDQETILNSLSPNRDPMKILSIQGTP